MNASSKSILQAPAVRALILQALSFLMVAVLSVVVDVFINFELSMLSVALLQGVMAALLSRWRGLATWWLPIQFFFPVAILAMLSLHLPPFIFLILFAFLLSLYWTTFRTQVPFYPSGPATWSAVAGMLPQNQSLKFIDVGSGLGGLILHLARHRPESEFIGIELAPLPWLISWLRARFSRSQSAFIRGDYNYLDFSQYDVVFAYLSPAAMPALWIKAHAEMRPGTLLLSHEFNIPNRIPDFIIKPREGGAALYGWRR